ncbi:hypothetical protein [Mycobacterium sp. E740]|uniref:hypothetical protein n=1 Tax=Mycobacterium sp. E740 TaxID=1834149 RepID=UPI0007FC10EF|nr:hypothetical protein [Mycobacterium sp. E740]OBI82123.1 hypothetical protein A5663_01465 [Mycobacterium sp. E740]
MISGPLAMLAILFDRLGRCESAATVMGFGDVPSSRLVFPEVDAAIAHLREVLDDEHDEHLSGTGAQMSTAAMVTFALDHIERLSRTLE